MQVLGLIKNRIEGEIAGLSFFDTEHGWLIWEWHIEGSSFVMLRTSNGGYNWHEVKLGGPGVLADWAFSSPDNGVAIVFPYSHDVPLGDDSGKTVAYYKMATRNGGWSWTLTETIANEDDRLYTDEDMPDNWWLEPSPRWTIRESQDTYSVQRMGDDGKWENVFTLPKTPYRNEE